MPQAWTFYRRSTDKQELSIEDQRAACQKYAAERGWVIVDEFVPPKGYASGLSIEKDEAFQRMVRLAEAGTQDVQYLLIYDVTRFGRTEPKRKFYWEEHFRRHGIKVVYAAEVFQNDGSLGDEIHQFVSHSEAHQFSLRLSKSTIRGSKSHATLGRSCGGRAPYGYNRLLVDSQQKPIRVLADGQRKSEKTEHVIWVPGRLERIEIVKAIFQAYARGSGLGTIVDDLNGRNVPSPYGGKWAKNTILSFLKNPAYIGTRVYFKHNYHQRDQEPKKWVRSAADWIVTENAHQPIIERDLFDQVQARFHTRKPRDGRHYDSPYLLSGMVRCDRCKHRYYGQMKHHEGKKTPYYLCGGYHSKGKHFCSAFSVQASILEGFALDEIQRRASQLKSSEVIAKCLDELFQRKPKYDNVSAGLKIPSFRRFEHPQAAC